MFVREGCRGRYTCRQALLNVPSNDTAFADQDARSNASAVELQPNGGDISACKRYGGKFAATGTT